jgi:Kef-type K+ transport system membrane component KefB/nucleotide-binding universal stress UspA family protein
MTHDASVVVFIAQLVALLLAGRIAGELMQRIGQPPVIGQIIAGVLLGPSVLGNIAPGLWHSLFPSGAAQKAMLDAVAQLGIVLLLLMTGMETDLGVFRDARRPALSISLTGIVVPFACGIALGALLPESMLPSPSRRLLTALFLGTALAISSVKIVALVVRDLGFVRRTVGQVIIAASILDDAIGWIIVSVLFGLAARGTIDAAAVTRSVVGTVMFLALSFTVGRRLVFRLIRWSNDNLTSEMATITTILIITGLMALLTDAIGVNLVLGAFVAGVLIGQSPMLTARSDAQLRGLIVGLFMPVFFALAGLSTDLAALGRPDFLLLTLGLIVLASVGKFLGAFVGGRIGGLSWAESLAVGCGMNARGSTEIIVASIGLSMGALTERLFTAVVAMAVVTTMAMPPMLRWALKRLPLRGEEKARIEREELEAQGLLSTVDRLLVAVDASPSGQFASLLVGLLAGVRRIPTTVLYLNQATPKAPVAAQAQQAERATAVVKAGVQAGDEAAVDASDTVDVMTRARALSDSEGAIAAEARKGYGMLFIGREPTAAGAVFDPQITRSVARFGGAFAVVAARGAHRRKDPAAPVNILVPVAGTRVSRAGAELAVALTQASRGSVTALYVASSRPRPLPWRQRFGRVLAPRSSGVAAIHEVIDLGVHYGVVVRGTIRAAHPRENSILREIHSGQYDLLVMGVSPHSGEQLSFGDAAAEILAHAPCSLLFVSGDPVVAPAAAAGAGERLRAGVMPTPAPVAGPSPLRRQGV